eukprot:14502610-Alexandrium_andersonii.AAC.1
MSCRSSFEFRSFPIPRAFVCLRFACAASLSHLLLPAHTRGAGWLAPDGQACSSAPSDVEDPKAGRGWAHTDPRSA